MCFLVSHYNSMPPATPSCIETFSLVINHTFTKYSDFLCFVQVFSDPHIKHIDLIKELDHPTAGRVKLVGPPVVYSEGRNEVRCPPPVLGQHTDDILTNLLGYSADKIDELRRKDIIQ